jgi:hypothetical protein
MESDPGLNSRRSGSPKGKRREPKGSGDEASREEGPSHPARGRPADPPALDGIPYFHYAGMYDIVKESAYEMWRPIPDQIPATTNRVALNRSAAAISGVAEGMTR